MSKPGPKPGRSAYSLQDADYTTTYQQEYVHCGKPGCHCATGAGHGPYWYAYAWSTARRRRVKTYCGKERPTAVGDAPVVAGE